MSTVLVTGGTGTLGRAVVVRLLNRHHRVRILSHQATIRSAEPADELYAMMRTGIILTPEHAEGKVTWEQYLQHILGKQPATAH